MKEVRKYAQSHVDVKNFKAITESMHQEQNGKSSEKARKPTERNDRGKKLVRTEDLDVPRLPNYIDYAPLKESRAKIFNLHKDDTKWQRPIQRKLAGKNPDAFCKFHECPRHWTEHCKCLMNNIEDLIQRGYFQQYKKEKDFVKIQAGCKSRRGGQTRNDEEPVQKKNKEILVIFQTSGIANSEAHLRAATASKLELMKVVDQEEPPPMPDMTSTWEDCRRVSYPHLHPLVMVVDIVDQSVHRVLLDSGAEVNVIYKSCWNQMDLEDKILKRSSTPIMGFSGESVQAEGKITLL